jgi:hypothetical protein
VIDSLRSDDRFHQSRSPGRGDEVSIPCRELAGTFILKMLQVGPFQACHRKRETKVSHREGGEGGRHPLKNGVKVNPLTTDRSDGALLEVGA